MAGVSVLCAVLVLLGVGWLLKCAHGSWLAPGPFFALYWAVGLALPPILAPEFDLSLGAVWYIVMLVAVFGFGSYVGAQRKLVRAEGLEPRALNLRRLRQLVVTGTVAGIVAAAVMQYANGYSLGAILTAQGVLDAAAAFSIDRYGGNISTPVVVPLLMAFTYAAALVAPFAAKGLSRRLAFACYAGPALGATAYAVLTTARAGMLAVAFFLFAGWIVATVRKRGEVPHLRPRAVLGAGLALAAVTVAFVSIAFLRVGTFDPTAQRTIGDKMVGYAVGYMPGFSHWLDESAPTGPVSWGAATFTGLLDFDGGSEAFTDRRPVGEGERTTNIFTAWRYLVDDFGFVGAPLAMFALGWLLTWAWRRVAEQPTTVPVVVLLAGYAYMLNSTTQTIFLFTNIVAAFVIAAVALSLRVRAPREVPESPHVRDARRARAAAWSGGRGEEPGEHVGQ